MITKDSTLGEILKYPKTKIVLAEFNIPCLTCPMAAAEMNKLKIGDICETYGIDSEKLIRKLNEIIADERD